jgi:hypothetical protein
MSVGRIEFTYASARVIEKQVRERASTQVPRENQRPGSSIGSIGIQKRDIRLHVRGIKLSGAGSRVVEKEIGMNRERVIRDQGGGGSGWKPSVEERLEGCEGI